MPVPVGSAPTRQQNMNTYPCNAFLLNSRRQGEFFAHILRPFTPILRQKLIRIFRLGKGPAR